MNKPDLLRYWLLGHGKNVLRYALSPLMLLVAYR